MKIEFFRLEEKHLEMVRNWRNLPEVNKYLYTDHNISKEEHLRWFQNISGDPTRTHWVASVDGQFVAYVNLYDINLRNKRCSWAYYIADPSARGKGIGKEIELNIQRYVFEILKDAKPSPNPPGPAKRSITGILSFIKKYLIYF